MQNDFPSLSLGSKRQMQAHSGLGSILVNRMLRKISVSQSDFCMVSNNRAEVECVVCGS